MEDQLKEAVVNSSLCFNTSGDELASLTLVEKYDRYLQDEHTDAESDGELYPDDTVLRQEYAQMKNNYKEATDKSYRSRLSLCIPGKYRSSIGTTSSASGSPDKSSTKTQTQREQQEEQDKSKDVRTGLNKFNELIEKLAQVRKCDPDGNSIFCTEEELLAIQSSYGEILDFIYEKSATFVKAESTSKDCDGQRDSDDTDGQDEEVEVKDTVPPTPPTSHSEDLRILAEKIESVQRTRDKFYEVEQHVKDYLEQLELVERYKMESVG